MPIYLLNLLLQRKSASSCFTAFTWSEHRAHFHLDFISSGDFDSNSESTRSPVLTRRFILECVWIDVLLLPLAFNWWSNSKFWLTVQVSQWCILYSFTVYIIWSFEVFSLTFVFSLIPSKQLQARLCQTSDGHLSLPSTDVVSQFAVKEAFHSGPSSFFRLFITLLVNSK